MQDALRQHAVGMSLIIIGEAATKITRDHPDIPLTFQDIPWDSMRGLRNRFAHGYLQIDFGLVWDTIQNDLPGLITQLEATLAIPANRQQ